MDSAQKAPADYVTYESEFVANPFGLTNTGATCWLNSLLQFMMGISSLNRTVLECEAELQNNVLARAYIAMLKQSETGGTGDNSAKILAALIAQAKAVGRPTTLSLGQECADEGFTIFLDLLNCPRVENLFANVYAMSTECKQCHTISSYNRDKAIRIQMTNNTAPRTQEGFCDYMRSRISVVDSVKCTECSAISLECNRLEELRMLREVVVITFNKFATKSDIFFPEKLEFGSTNKTRLHYKLVGKIEHSGSAAGGHYWCHSLRGAGWKQMNDSNVSGGTPARTDNTFMIAYHMVDPDSI